MSKMGINLEHKLLIFLRILFGICFLVTISIIFYLSLQHEADSLENSGAITELVNEFSFLFFTESVIRKIAHFCEFMLAGFWLILLMNILLEHTGQCISWTLLIGLLVSLVDETIQIFIPGRASLVSDVWIDLAGIIFGIITGYIAMYLLTAIIKKHRPSEGSGR